MATASMAKPPHPFWTLTEGRAIFEFDAFGLFRKRMLDLPKGDGHPVLVLPGFMASDRSTKPMRRLFDDLGYTSYGWGLGRNVRFNEQREREIEEKEKKEAERRRIDAEGKAAANRILSASITANILKEKGISATLRKIDRASSSSAFFSVKKSR